MSDEDWTAAQCETALMESLRERDKLLGDYEALAKRCSDLIVAHSVMHDQNVRLQARYDEAIEALKATQNAGFPWEESAAQKLRIAVLAKIGGG